MYEKENQRKNSDYYNHYINPAGNFTVSVLLHGCAVVYVVGMVDKVLVPSGFTLRSYEYLIGRGGSTNSMMWVESTLEFFCCCVPDSGDFCDCRSCDRIFGVKAEV